MKVLVFSDLHAHNYKKFDENESRLFNCLRVVENCFTIAHENGITYIIFTGDLYDQQKALPTIVVNMMIQVLFELFKAYPNIHIISISGNHDHSSKNLLDIEAHSALFHLDLIFDNFHIIDNKSLHIKDGDDNVVFHGIPYYSHREHFLQKVKENPLEMNAKNYLMIHQTPKHSNPMIQHDFEGSELSNYDYVFCGHIHKHEQITNNVVLVGSPLHRDLGDEGQEKGVLIFDTKTDTYERIILNYPKIQLSNELDAFNYNIPILDIGIQQDSDDQEDEIDIELSDTMEVMISSYLATQNFDEDQLLEYYEIGKSLI